MHSSLAKKEWIQHLKNAVTSKSSKALKLFYLHILVCVEWISMSFKRFQMLGLGKLKNGLVEVRMKNSDLIFCK